MNSTSRNLWLRWCPLLWWAITLFLALLVTNLAGQLLFARAGAKPPGVVAAVAIAGSLAAITLEMFVRRGYVCSWIPERAYGRWGLYALGLIVGAFLLSTMNPGVPNYYRVAAVVLFVVPVFSMLVIHSQREHAEAADAKYTRILVIFSEWPFYLLLLFTMLLVCLFVFSDKVVIAG